MPYSNIVFVEAYAKKYGIVSQKLYCIIQNKNPWYTLI